MVAAAVLDIEELGLRGATIERTGVDSIQFVEDTITLGHARDGLRRAHDANHGGRAGKAEQPGQEQSSIHGNLPIYACISIEHDPPPKSKHYVFQPEPFVNEASNAAQGSALP